MTGNECQIFVVPQEACYFGTVVLIPATEFSTAGSQEAVKTCGVTGDLLASASDGVLGASPAPAGGPPGKQACQGQQIRRGVQIAQVMWISEYQVSQCRWKNRYASAGPVSAAAGVRRDSSRMNVAVSRVYSGLIVCDAANLRTRAGALSRLASRRACSSVSVRSSCLGSSHFEPFLLMVPMQKVELEV